MFPEETRSQQEWDPGQEIYEPIQPDPWRRRVLVAVAVVTVIAMAAVPIYNLIESRDRPVADNGLQICGFDYCTIQDAVVAAGYGDTMSRLANTYLSDIDASALADQLLAHVGESGVTFVMVDDLKRRVSGEYSPDERVIRVERPARAWIVLHEVAHTVAPGHGDEFVAELLDLIDWLDVSAT